MGGILDVGFLVKVKNFSTVVFQGLFHLRHAVSYRIAREGVRNLTCSASAIGKSLLMTIAKVQLSKSGVSLSLAILQKHLRAWAWWQVLVLFLGDGFGCLASRRVKDQHGRRSAIPKLIS